jgi:hypothetical protein
MQEKVIEFVFDYNDFMESRKTLWAYSFKKQTKSYIAYTALPIVILTIRFIGDNGDPFSLIVGFGLLAYIIVKWLELNSNRQKFLKQSRQYAERFQNSASNITYILSENTIEYKDNEKSYKLNWHLFNSYVFFRDSILLTVKDSKTPNFILTRRIIGDKNFVEVCEFLNEKLVKTTNQSTR